MTSPPAQRTERKPASTLRAEIIDAASAEFALTGLAGTSLESIAARAEISHPRIVQMFGSKRALFLDVLAAAYQRIGTGFDRAAGGSSNGGVPLIVLGEAYRRLLLRDRNIALVILQGYAAAHDETVRTAAARHHTDLQKRVAAISGADEFDVRTFIATGLVVTVSTALGLRSRKKDDAWAATLLTSCERD